MWLHRSAQGAHAPSQDRRAPWLALIRDLPTQTRNTRFGLLMHWCSGPLEGDIVLSDRQSLPLVELNTQRLDPLRDDAPYEFRR